jgi:toxin HigB-1
MTRLIGEEEGKSKGNKRLDLLRFSYYVFAMIATWKNASTRKVWEGIPSNAFRSLDEEFALELLAALNVAKSLSDLSPLKSLGLHKLKGDRKDQWAMTVNARWRICFKFKDGNAYDVEIVDDHKG